GDVFAGLGAIAGLGISALVCRLAARERAVDFATSASAVARAEVTLLGRGDGAVAASGRNTRAGLADFARPTRGAVGERSSRLALVRAVVTGRGSGARIATAAIAGRVGRDAAEFTRVATVTVGDVAVVTLLGRRDYAVAAG